MLQGVMLEMGKSRRSRDSDFLALTTYLRRGKKKVYTFSSKNNVSLELRTGTDGYLA
jgi:hypothetical protein